MDEFQDISAGRARLIKALAGQSPSHRLFCVGDDWQSIYRFAGSDIALMRDFEQHFGPAQTVLLDQTFRFNAGINAVATRFVLANPDQISKEVQAPRPASGPAVVIHRASGDGRDRVMAALAELHAQRHGGTASVLVLGRYRAEGDRLPWPAIRRQFPHLEVEFKTVHGAKGLEADAVVVLGMRAGRHGFPSEVADDALLDLVLATPEAFPHAEERRLFYVALTRARHVVHLIAESANPSDFVREIQGYGPDVAARGGAIPDPVGCPRCKRGVLVARTGEHGVFYGCSRYPACDYKTSACRRCGTGLLVAAPDDSEYRCNNPACGHRERGCPRCKTGRLIERRGRHGSFLGCTNYQTHQCRYTEPLS